MAYDKYQIKNVAFSLKQESGFQIFCSPNEGPDLTSTSGVAMMIRGFFQRWRKKQGKKWIKGMFPEIKLQASSGNASPHV